MEEQDTDIQEGSVLQEFILRFNDKDIAINVDTATAYLLTNDHNYAEQYAEAVLNDEEPTAPPDIEYLIEDGEDTSSPISDLEPLITLSSDKEEDSENNFTGSSNTLWTFGHMELLLNIRLSMESQFTQPSSKKLCIWNKIAEKVNSLTTLNTTGSVCYSKWRNMIKTYKRVLKNVKATGKMANWPLYDVLFETYGDLTISENIEDPKTDSENILSEEDAKLWQHADVKSLVSSRLEMQELFMQPDKDKDELWTSISQRINSVALLPHPGVACKTKWLYLLDTYKRKLNCFEAGEDPYVWPYFKMFYDIYKGFTLDKNGEDIKEERTGIWTDTITKLLIQTRIDMDYLFKSQKTPRSRLWSRVALKINAASNSDICVVGPECNSKWQHLMNSYRKISYMIHEAGNTSSTWPYYDLINQLFDATDGTTKTFSHLELYLSDEEDDDDDIEDFQKEWPSSDVDMLVSCRFEMHDTFSDTGCNRDELWTALSHKINAVSSLKHPGRACKIKWLQLLSTYKKKLVCNKNGDDPFKWPHFQIFHDKYKGVISSNTDDYSQPEKSFLWTHENTDLLIQTRIGMDNKFQCQSVKRTTLWSKVAAVMNSVFHLNLTGLDCDTKWRNLMATYRKIQYRISETGENTSSWPYYSLINKLCSTNKSGNPKSNNGESTPLLIVDEDDEISSSQKYWVPEIVNTLVKARTEMDEKFQNPKCKRYHLWNEIAKVINQDWPNVTFSGDECNVKWRNLKRTYRVLLSKMQDNHHTKPIWPYFSSFHELYGDLQNKSSVEMEVSFNEDHGYVFEVVPSGILGTSEEQNELLAAEEIAPLPPSSETRKSFSEPEPSLKNKSIKRSKQDIEQPISGPNNMNSDIKEEKWLKLMLLDWKKDRRERWEEKKKIERDKITAINNLTKAILSLERQESKRT